jgi:hypothetical protein
VSQLIDGFQERTAMKKQTAPRKLEIQRETLLLLDCETLEQVQGGGLGSIDTSSKTCTD